MGVTDFVDALVGRMWFLVRWQMVRWQIVRGQGSWHRTIVSAERNRRSESSQALVVTLMRVGNRPAVRAGVVKKIVPEEKQ
jgi:hypothetical protein